jgi:hypothetical protein
METNVIDMPTTIGGASGAIKLNPNLAMDNTNAAGNRNPYGATKSKSTCC